jgi:fructose-1,6-bisphosphatase/inositol monophosphatase family enzyme
VTAADLGVERVLAPELAALLPGSVVVAEEAAAADPALIDALASDRPVWLLDPLDGTRNFAAGRETFGSMLALALRGEPRLAWIHLPVRDDLYVAEAGAGAFLGGRRIAAAAEGAGAGPRIVASIYDRFMPGSLRAAVEARAAATMTVVPAPGSACIEYTDLARGAKDAVVYHRLLPWDHAAGVLIVTEAGGAARHADGRRYRATDATGPLLVVRRAGQWEEVRRLLLPPGVPGAGAESC